MSKSSRKIEPDPHKSTAEYYKLNTQAVDDLVNADESNSPRVSKEELDKYRRRGRFHLSDTFKCLFIKFWFPAVECFFFMWGLGSLNILDLLVILSIAGGMITDLLTNNVLRFIAVEEHSNDKWMMVAKKRKVVSMLLNILYAAVLIVLVYNLYNVINTAAVRFFGAAEDAVTLGVEPILFGLFYLGFDLLLIKIKQVFLKILHDAENKVSQSR